MDDNAILEAFSGILTAQETLTKRVESLEETNHELMRRSEILRRLVDNAPYEIRDERYEFSYVYPKFESIDETIRQIVEEKKSMARFGDGEFAIMQGIKRHEFQKNDDMLAERLKEVLESNLPNLIIGIADNYGDISRFTDEAAHGIRMHMSREMRNYLDDILDKGRVYADAYITRFYALFRDNKTDAPKKRISMLRTIWENRHVITVEGSKTGLGVGNDLFENASSFHRIICPAINSFDAYEDILKNCVEFGDKDTLFLIALGPTAGVLAYDLTKNGFQALDIGHVDLEYEWYLSGRGCRVPVQGKYNNEVQGGAEVDEITDATYLSQVLARV